MAAKMAAKASCLLSAGSRALLVHRVPPWPPFWFVSRKPVPRGLTWETVRGEARNVYEILKEPTLSSHSTHHKYNLYPPPGKVGSASKYQRWGKMLEALPSWSMNGICKCIRYWGTCCLIQSWTKTDQRVLQREKVCEPTSSSLQLPCICSCLPWILNINTAEVPAGPCLRTSVPTLNSSHPV